MKWLSLPHDGTSCSLCGGSLCEDIVHHNSYIFCQALLTDHGRVILGGFVASTVCLGVALVVPCFVIVMRLWFYHCFHLVLGLWWL